MSGDGGLLVIGGGGQGKVVLAALLALGRRVEAVLDDDPERLGERMGGLVVQGPVTGYPTGGKPGILAVGDNAARRRLSAELGCRWQAVIHPTAWVDPSARLGEGAFVAAGAIIQPGAVIGAHAIINTGATIDHDCVVGRYAHVAPGAHLAGDVRIGEGTLVGVGAGATPGVRIGAWSVLGAGAMAVRDLGDRVIAVGLPARERP